MADSPYEKIRERCAEIALYKSAASTLGWDQETYMPRNGLSYRAEQLAFLGGKAHRLFTDRDVGGWISAAEDAGAADGDSVEAANLRALRWRYDRATKLPAEFVEERARVSAMAKAAWSKARQESDFETFRPHLSKTVELAQTEADYFGYPEVRYDALLESYERGATTAAVGEVFGSMKGELSEIGAAAAEKSRALPADLLAGDYPVHQQQAFNREVAAAFGFDFGSGRIDTTTHPFCTGLAPGDTRLTTRYDERDFTSSLYGIMHEAGHGMYEQGLPVEHHGMPAGDSCSLGIHESQSRLWENHVGRAPAFWEHWFPRASSIFPALGGKSAADLAAMAGRSEPGFIRVDADEASYDLHIILRFEIEQGLVSGDLAVADVPAAWNEQFETLFGKKVERDADGCLQDIHWSMGALGYFPTYTLGNLCAAQLFAKAREEQPQIDSELADGEYGSLLAWMREKVHAPGAQLLPAELIERATGEPLSPRYHLDHLRARYL